MKCERRTEGAGREGKGRWGGKRRGRGDRGAEGIEGQERGEGEKREKRGERGDGKATALLNL